MPTPVATLPEAASVLDSYGGATAALKQVVELQPCANNRSVRVMVDGYCNWQETRLLEPLSGMHMEGLAPDPGV